MGQLPLKIKISLPLASARKIRLWTSFLTLNKMAINVFSFSEISNNLGILRLYKSESSQWAPKTGLIVITVCDANAVFIVIATWNKSQNKYATSNVP